VLAFTSAHTANKMGTDNMHCYRWLSVFQGNHMVPFFFCSENGGHKNSQSFIKLHGIISQKTTILIHTTVRTSDLIWEHINL